MIAFLAVTFKRPKALLSDQRGIENVIDIHELVHILREERAADIVCIEVPPSDGPSRYIVICCPFNYRHGRALCETVRKCYKIKRNQEVHSHYRAYLTCC